MYIVCNNIDVREYTYTYIIILPEEHLQWAVGLGAAMRGLLNIYICRHVRFYAPLAKYWRHSIDSPYWK